MIRMISMTGFARCAVVLAAITLAGCSNSSGNNADGGKKTTTAKPGSTRKQPAPTDTAQTKTDPNPSKVEEKTPEPDTPPIAKVPPVVMSKQHRDSLTVFQNDALPAAILDGELVGLDGKKHTLRSELGEKLTILLFWSSDHAYAAEELKYVAASVAQQYGSQGVKIVTVNQRDDQKQALEAAGRAGASSLVTLLDSEKTLAQLASGSVPRTYLLDAQGRVLWLDTVFDRTTRRDLSGALDFVLSKNQEVIGSSTSKDGDAPKHR